MVKENDIRLWIGSCARVDVSRGWVHRPLPPVSLSCSALLPMLSLSPILIPALPFDMLPFSHKYTSSILYYKTFSNSYISSSLYHINISLIFFYSTLSHSFNQFSLLLPALFPTMSSVPFPTLLLLTILVPVQFFTTPLFSPLPFPTRFSPTLVPILYHDDLLSPTLTSLFSTIIFFHFSASTTIHLQSLLYISCRCFRYCIHVYIFFSRPVILMPLMSSFLSYIALSFPCSHWDVPRCFCLPPPVSSPSITASIFQLIILLVFVFLADVA